MELLPSPIQEVIKKNKDKNKPYKIRFLIFFSL